MTQRKLKIGPMRQLNELRCLPWAWLQSPEPTVKWKERTDPTKVVLWPPHSCHGTCTPTHIHHSPPPTHTHGWGLLAKIEQQWKLWYSVLLCGRNSELFLSLYAKGPKSFLSKTLTWFMMQLQWKEGVLRIQPCPHWALELPKCETPCAWLIVKACGSMSKW